MESNVGKKLKLSDIELLDRTVIDDDSLKKMLIESFNPNGIPFGIGVVRMNNFIETISSIIIALLFWCSVIGIFIITCPLVR